MMNLSAVGKSTLEVEVSHISAHGIWLLIENQELFMPYEEFPWFQEVIRRLGWHKPTQKKH